MKKLLILILSIVVAISIVGCRTETEPNQPPVEEPQESVEYPYDEIEVENVVAIEIYNGGEQTPRLEDADMIQKVVTLIQNAEYIGEADDNGEIENEWGMRIYLRDEILESNQVIIRYIVENNRLYIGPQGREFLVESKELAEFIQDNLKGRFLFVEETAIPEEARQWLKQFEQEKGAYVYQHPDATYIKITSEEKPTGGYDILVREFNENEYPKEITIEIVEPDSDAMVIQAITYPTIYLKVQSEEATQYAVKTMDGEEYDVEDLLIFAKIDKPEENEEIANPVRVQGKIIAFEGSFVVRILDEENNLIHEEILQADAGGPAWGNFDEEISYPEPNTDKGSLELGEYSAKDGSYLLREKVEISFK